MDGEKYHKSMVILQDYAKCEELHHKTGQHCDKCSVANLVRKDGECDKIIAAAAKYVTEEYFRQNRQP
jgi:hypothetical protein